MRATVQVPPKVAVKKRIKFTFLDVNQVVEAVGNRVPSFSDVNRVAPTNGGAKVPPTL